MTPSPSTLRWIPSPIRHSPSTSHLWYFPSPSPLQLPPSSSRWHPPPSFYRWLPIPSTLTTSSFPLDESLPLPSINDSISSLRWPPPSALSMTPSPPSLYDILNCLQTTFVFNALLGNQSAPPLSGKFTLAYPYELSIQKNEQDKGNALCMQV